MLDGLGFGSLSAFLGDEGLLQMPPRMPSKTHLPSKLAFAPIISPGVPLPLRPSPTKRGPHPCVDGTMLNRKLAFKMLKQLGCDIRGGHEQGTCQYIEVGKIGQPVLFQMLIEFGYDPIAGADGSQVIRVMDQPHRSAEKLVADLCRPRKVGKRNDSDIEFPEGCADGFITGQARPKLRKEEEEELVKRLAAPRPPKSTVAEVDPQEPPKFRTKAEQEAHLNRLVRPRGIAAVDEDLECHRPLGPIMCLVDYVDEKADTSPFCQGGVSTVRPSPRLARAGFNSLARAASAASSFPINSEDPVLNRTPSPTGPNGVIEPTPFPASPSTGPIAGIERRRSHRTAHNEQKTDISDIVAKMFGVPAWPGRAAPVERSKVDRAQHLERLERLAKPRQRKEVDDGDQKDVVKPTRCPRSQQEACNRLAQPRHQPSRCTNPSGMEVSPEFNADFPSEGPLDFSAYASLVGSDPIGGPLDFSSYTSNNAGLGGSFDFRDPIGCPLDFSSHASNNAALGGSFDFTIQPPTRADYDPGFDVTEHPSMFQDLDENARGPDDDYSEDSTNHNEVTKVILVPSLLSECSGRLSRIEEESFSSACGSVSGSVKGIAGASVKGEQARAGKCRQRCSSLPSNRDRSRGLEVSEPTSAAFRRSRDSKNPASYKRHPPPLLPGDSRRTDQHPTADEDDMLDDIDRLYTEMLAKNPAAPPADGSDLGIVGVATKATEAEHFTTSISENCLQRQTSRTVSSATPSAVDETSASQSCQGSRVDSTSTALPFEVLPTPANKPTSYHPSLAPCDPCPAAGICAGFPSAHVDSKSSNTEQPVSAASMRVSADQAEQIDEETNVPIILELLKEVLWTALLAFRNGSCDFQVGLLQILDAEVLAACFRACGGNAMSPSLSQRLQSEMPGLYDALAVAQTTARSGNLESSVEMLGLEFLVQALRQARDHILALAAGTDSSKKTVEEKTTDHEETPSAHPKIGKNANGAVRAGTHLSCSGMTTCAGTPSSRASRGCAGGRRNTFAASKRGNKSSLSHWMVDDLESM